MEGPQRDANPPPADRLQFPHLNSLPPDSSPPPLPSRLPLWSLLLGLGLVVVGGAAWLLTAQSSQPPVVSQLQEPAGLPVSVVSVQTAQIPRLVDVTGAVTQQAPLPVRSQITGMRIQAVTVARGANVQAGQVLAVLDTSDLSGQLQAASASYEAARAAIAVQQGALVQAQAQLTQAQAEAERYQQLLEEGAVSQQEVQIRGTQTRIAAQQVELARASIASTQASAAGVLARVRQIQSQLQQTAEVRAPFPGTVVQTLARPGDLTSDQQMFLVARADQIEFRAQMNVQQGVGIQPGQPAQVHSAAAPNLELTGRVRAVGPLANDPSSLATVFISLPPSPELKPGMPLDARILIGQTQGLAVPPSAVSAQPDGSTQVFVVDSQGVAHARTVKLGLTTPEAVQISEGLSPGERVATSSVNQLKDGARVQVLP